MSDVVDGCFACGQNTAPELPAREEVVRTASWRVSHAFDTALPGWLVVTPTRHVRALHELDGPEAAELGSLLRDLSAALREVVGCARTYVALFAEAEGFAHLHVHVVPRAADLPEELRGPGVFALLGRPRGERVPETEADRLAEALGAALDGAREGGARAGTG